MHNEVSLFFPIFKVDGEKRLIRGIITGEFLDKSGEVLSYEGSKQGVGDWSGAVREMHSNIAVGRDVEREFDDASKTITVTARISKGAPDTLEKLRDGTLKFFSIGGRRKKSTIRNSADLPASVFKFHKGKRPETVRHTTEWEMVELSLVDNPALPMASFELVKMVDGRPRGTEILSKVERSVMQQATDLKKRVEGLKERLAKFNGGYFSLEACDRRDTAKLRSGEHDFSALQKRYSEIAAEIGQWKQSPNHPHLVELQTELFKVGRLVHLGEQANL
jgi:hypothetical protein